MKKYLTLALTLIFAACTPTPTVAPLTGSPLPSNNPISVTAAPQEVIPTTVIQSTVVNISGTTGNLWLQVLSPLDEAVVNTHQVDVVGSAPAGAVISINEEILIVGADGHFKATESLEEGPNLIEIIVSDEDGNEMTALLTITYEP